MAKQKKHRPATKKKPPKKAASNSSLAQRLTIIRLLLEIAIALLTILEIGRE